jgi:hypothetical protein
MGVVSGLIETGRISRGLVAPGFVHRSLRALSAGANAPLAPVQNWRLPISAAYDSAGTATASLAASSSTKTWPVLFIGTTLGETRVFAVKVDAVGSAGGFLAFTAFLLNTATNWTVEFEESTDSTDGVDGTWTDITWTPYFPTGSNANLRLHPIPIAPGPERWVRGTLVNNTGVGMQLYVGAFAWPESGLPDAWVVCGASLEADGHRSMDMINSFRAIHTDRDPVVFSYAKSGASSADVETFTSESLTLYPKASYWIFDTGGNTVTNNRPWPGAQETMHDQVQGAIQAIKAAGKVASCTRLTYRNYTASPAVNGLTNQENGSKPYNEGMIDPIILEELPDHYDDELGIGRVDLYSVVLANRTILDDDPLGIHPSAAGYGFLRTHWADSFARWIYTGSWPLSQVEQYVATAEGNSNTTNVAAARHTLAALPTSAKRTALEDRAAVAALNGADAAVTAAEAAASQATKDIAQTAVDLMDETRNGAQKTALQTRIDAILVIEQFITSKINVGGDATAITGWQHWQPVTNSSRTLTDDTGTATGWSIARSNVPETALASGGRALDSADGKFPSSVNISYARFNNTANQTTLTISGLDNTKLYDLAFVSSRITVDTTYRTRYTVNGDTGGAITLNPADATPPTASFTNVSPSGGAITVLVDRGASPGSSVFGYLNGIWIRQNVIPPENTVAPVITGTTVEGSTLTGSNGSWSGSVASYSRQWLRDGAEISGATNSTYVLTEADVGTDITFRVTANNAGGNDTATSDAVVPTGLVIIGKLNVGADTTPIAGWQQWNQNTTASLGVLNESGAASGWTISRGTDFPETVLSTGGRLVDTANGRIPAAVNGSFSRFNPTKTSMTMTLSGLNNAKTYDLTFSSSRITAATNYRTRFTVNGDTGGAIVLNPADAVPPTADFTNVSPVGGVITILLDRNNTADATAFAYLNGIWIRQNG